MSGACGGKNVIVACEYVLTYNCQRSKRAEVDIVVMERQGLNTKRLKIALEESRGYDSTARRKVGLWV